MNFTPLTIGTREPITTTNAVLFVMPDAEWDAIVAEHKPVSNVVAEMDVEVHLGRIRRHEKHGGRKPGKSDRYFAKRWGWSAGRVWGHFTLMGWKSRGLAG